MHLAGRGPIVAPHAPECQASPAPQHLVCVRERRFEMVMKLFALGAGYVVPAGADAESEHAGYFASHWNRLDCFVVLMSWVLYLYTEASNDNQISNLARSLRLVRLSRPLDFLRNHPSRRLRQVSPPSPSRPNCSRTLTPWWKSCA